MLRRLSQLPDLLSRPFNHFRHQERPGALPSPSPSEPNGSARLWTQPHRRASTSHPSAGGGSVRLQARPVVPAQPASDPAAAAALPLPRSSEVSAESRAFYSRWIDVADPRPIRDPESPGVPGWFRSGLRVIPTPVMTTTGSIIELTPWQKTLFDHALLAMSATRALIEPGNQLRSAYRTGFEAAARHVCLPEQSADSVDARFVHAIQSGAGNCVDMAVCTFNLLAAEPALSTARIRVITSRTIDHAVVMVDDVVVDAWDPKGVPYLKHFGNPGFDVARSPRIGVACEKRCGEQRGSQRELSRTIQRLLADRRDYPGDRVLALNAWLGAKVERVFADEALLIDVNGLTPTNQAYRLADDPQEVFSYGHVFPAVGDAAELALGKRSNAAVRGPSSGFR